MTSSDLAKYSTTQSIARPLCDSWASCYGIRQQVIMLLLLHPAVNRGGCWNKSGTFMACGVWLFSAHHCGGRFKRRPHRVFATCNRKTDYANFNQLQRYVLIIFMMSVITTSNSTSRQSISANAAAAAFTVRLFNVAFNIMLHERISFSMENFVGDTWYISRHIGPAKVAISEETFKRHA